MKKIVFVFLLIFSLLIISGKVYECEAKEESFNKIEKFVKEQCDFVENGVKLEYTVKSSIEKEYDRIVKIIKEKHDFIILKEKNCILVKSKNINYSVNIYDYGKMIKVEVIVINKNPNITENDLKYLVNEIKSDKFIDDRYFSFIKGKINTNSENITDNIKKSLKVEIKEELNISNGHIAKGVMGHNTNVNIGQINYDTGSYLIIGTPIIFVTY